MRLYNYNITLLFRRLLIALGLFFFSRLFFYIYNIGLYADISFAELLKIFFLGVRFDISVICYFNLLFILFHVIPWSSLYRKNWFQLTLKLYFVIVNGLLTFGNFADSIYFHFTQKRSTADVYKFIFVSDDVLILLPSFIKDYWYIGLLVGILIYLIWKLYPGYKPSSKKTNANPNNLKTVIYKVVAMLLLLSLSIVGGRGGLQLKPISIIDASKNVKATHMPLVLNSIFTVMTTYGRHYLEERTYFENPEQYYSPVYAPKEVSDDFNNKNVVILLLESFSREYVGSLNNYKGYTPFLDSLSEHSLVFKNAFSNGLRSIDAIPAVVTGVPLLMDDPFITSIYSTNTTFGMAEVLNEKGYHTAFFHGGNNGTMNFDGFSDYAGFHEYFGRTEYDNDDDYDGYWGIYDEPFLKFMINKLDEFEQPFFAFEFTLSSHYPYSVPDNRAGMFKEGPMKIHKVVSYTDFALKEFFNEAQNTSWYNNTVFVILADHPAQSVIPNLQEDVSVVENNIDKELTAYYKNTIGRYAIPMLIFAPGDTNMVGTSEKVVQQTDIFPTIMEYLNCKKPVFAFGNNMLNDSVEGIAVHFVNGLYQITKGDYSLLSDGNNPVFLYNNITDPLHKRNLVSELPQKSDSLNLVMKSILQQYTNRMIKNDLKIN